MSIFYAETILFSQLNSLESKLQNYCPDQQLRNSPGMPAAQIEQVHFIKQVYFIITLVGALLFGIKIQVLNINQSRIVHALEKIFTKNQHIFQVQDKIFSIRRFHLSIIQILMGLQGRYCSSSCCVYKRLCSSHLCCFCLSAGHWHCKLLLGGVTNVSLCEILQLKVTDPISKVTHLIYM